MNCDRCRNSGICKYEDNAKEYEVRFNAWNTAQDALRPDILKLNFNCKRFLMRYKGGPSNPTQLP